MKALKISSCLLPVLTTIAFTGLFFFSPAQSASYSGSGQAVEVEAYDLRGKGYTNPQIGATAKAYSQDKLVILVSLDTAETAHEKAILAVVKGNMQAGYTNVRVLFADRGKAEANIVLVAKGVPIPNVILLKDPLYELDLSIGLKSTYKSHYREPDSR